MRAAAAAAAAVATLAIWIWAAVSFGHAQQAAPATAALMKMVETERAFAQRAQETNWRDAFLEYFADGTKGFEGEDVKQTLRSRPAPPKDLEFWWEPRYGDIAASGDLGWLTGPVRQRHPKANEGQPTFSNYSSVWRRQPDGTYKVIEDVGISTPAVPPFAPGFSRVPLASRYSGSEPGTVGKASLAEADRRFISALRASQANAYAATAAAPARLHRPGAMPIVGRDAIVVWARTQPDWQNGESQLAVVAESADLGYTRGSYTLTGTGSAAVAESGHYLRVWSRDAGGVWHVVLDVTQPRAQRK